MCVKRWEFCRVAEIRRSPEDSLARVQSKKCKQCDGSDDVAVAIMQAVPLLRPVSRRSSAVPLRVVMEQPSKFLLLSG